MSRAENHQYDLRAETKMQTEKLKKSSVLRRIIKNKGKLTDDKKK